jgi:hypothetical protein
VVDPDERVDEVVPRADRLLDGAKRHGRVVGAPALP